ncbi:MAG: SIS domain-containing protein [Candidatus Asgardarchaeia archaeon]
MEVRKSHPYMMWDEIRKTPEALRKCLKEPFMRDVEDAVNLIVDKDVVFLSGCGTSLHVAHFGDFMMSEVAGLPSKFLPSFLMHYYPPPDLDENSVLILISHSGKTKATVDLMRWAKRNGIITIGIVGNKESPLGMETNVSIIDPLGQEIPAPKTRSTFVNMMAITLLSIKLSEMYGYDSSELMKECKEVPDLIESQIKEENFFKELSEKYKDIENLYFVGGGLNYPIAKEGALKIKEAGSVHAEGFEVEEVAHGRISVIYNKPFGVILASKEPSLSRGLEILKASKTVGARTFLISDKEINEDFIDDKFKIPELGEELSTFVTLMPLYMFSYFVSVKRGLNPDLIRMDLPDHKKALREILFPPGTH